MNLNLSDLEHVVAESSAVDRQHPYRHYALINYWGERHRLWIPESWLTSFVGGEVWAVAEVHS